MWVRSVHHPASTSGVTAYIRAFMIREDMLTSARTRHATPRLPRPSSARIPKLNRAATHVRVDGLFDRRIERRRHVFCEELFPDARGALCRVARAGLGPVLEV